MDPSTIRVLLVGDRTGLASGVRRLLQERVDILLETVDDPTIAVDVARAVRPDVIFQEWEVSGTPGLEFLEAYGRTSGLSEVPVIMLAEGTENAFRSASFAAGAADHLVEQPGEIELMAKIRMQSERRRTAVERRKVSDRLLEADREISSLRAQIVADGANDVKEAERDLARLVSLADLGDEVNRFQDFDLLLDHILTQARRACEAESGAIFIVDRKRLIYRHLQNDLLDGRGDRNHLQPVERPLTMDTVAGTVAITGTNIRVDDAYDMSPDFECVYDRGRDIATGYRTRSLLSIPLRTSDRVVRGVLQLANPGGEAARRSFSLEDEKVVEHFASLAAVAIERTAMTETLVLRMISMAEVRDPTETGPHVQRVAGCAVILYEAWARASGIPDEERDRNRDRLRTAAMLHDVGKIAIPDAILKKPGPLDDHELAIMQQHTVIGARLFKGMRTDFDEVAQVVALHHHERWDGTGYPGPVELDSELLEPTVPTHRGLSGTDIPLFARIVGLVDVYDALSTRRSYKDAWPEEDVLEIIRRESGTHFDPQLVELLLEHVDEMRLVRSRFVE
ncbi:MAG: phosphohydrolase [Planctomycetaceae bacterium]|nr:phosphohydrolase [Planctomycetaceae bacterium]